jgi:hypothetical protein
MAARAAVDKTVEQKPLTTETQRHREKQNLFYGFLCASVSLWLMVLVTLDEPGTQSKAEGGMNHPISSTALAFSLYSLFSSG